MKKYPRFKGDYAFWYSLNMEVAFYFGMFIALFEKNPSSQNNRTKIT